MTPALPTLRPKQVLRALERAGFFIRNQTGSHAQLRHPGRPELRVTVPMSNKDLPKGTLKSILNQAGMTPEELRRYL